MPKASNLASEFSKASLSKARVRAFATHISRVEAESGIDVARALINGLAPFDDVPTVEFKVPKSKLGGLLEKLLSNPRVNPNVIINGTPALDHFNVRVIPGR